MVFYEVDGEMIPESEYVKIIREQYAANPPEGYTSEEIREMDDEYLLDMDYFLNE